MSGDSARGHPRRWRALAHLSGGLGIAAAAAAQGQAASSPCGPPDLAEQTVQALNALRASGGQCASHWLPPAPALRWSDTAARAASAHARDMAHHNRMAHQGSDGSHGAERLDRVGYVWGSWGENLGQGHRDVATLLAQWHASPGHCANLLNQRFTELGMACARGATGTPFWALTLARPAGVPAPRPERALDSAPEALLPADAAPARR